MQTLGGKLMCAPGCGSEVTHTGMHTKFTDSRHNVTSWLTTCDNIIFIYIGAERIDWNSTKKMAIRNGYTAFSLYYVHFSHMHK